MTFKVPRSSQDTHLVFYSSQKRRNETYFKEISYPQELPILLNQNNLNSLRLFFYNILCGKLELIELPILRLTQ